MSKFLAPEEKHWRKLPIADVIFSDPSFIVFINTDGGVDWRTSEEYYKVGYKSDIEHYSILNEAALLEATPSRGWDPELVRHYRWLIGEALSRSFADDYINARKMLAAAGSYILARSQEQSRYWYVLASASAVLPFWLLALILLGLRNFDIAPIRNEYFWLALSAVGGATGAFLSITTRSSTLNFDSSSGQRLHIIEGVGRIVGSAIAGLLVAVAVKAGLVLGTIGTDPTKLHLIQVLASIAAGAGERLAPSIISSTDSSGVSISEKRQGIISPATTKIVGTKGRLSKSQESAKVAKRPGRRPPGSQG